MLKNVLPMFLSKNFVVSGLKFRSLIHFELIFIYGISEMTVTQLCPTLRPHGLYSPWNSLGQNAGVGGFSFLQEIFPTQGSNPGLPHCRQIFYHLSHQGTPYGIRECSNFIILHVPMQFSKHYLLNRLLFSFVFSCLLCL